MVFLRGHSINQKIQASGGSGASVLPGAALSFAQMAGGRSCHGETWCRGKRRVPARTPGPAKDGIRPERPERVLIGYLFEMGLMIDHLIIDFMAWSLVSPRFCRREP